MRRSVFYAWIAIAGFVVLSVGVPMIVYMFFMSVSMEITKYSGSLDQPVHVIDEDELREFPYVKDGIEREEEREKAGRCIGYAPCINHSVVSLNVYQARSIGDRFQLNNNMFYQYFGPVEYNGNYYYLHIDTQYQEFSKYLSYGLAGIFASVTGISFAWIKFGQGEKVKTVHNWKALIWLAGFFVGMIFLLNIMFPFTP